MADPTRLDEAIDNLRAEIRSLSLGDEASRRRLEALIEDIERTRDRTKPGATDAGVGDRLSRAVLDFEASHPRLATVMNELVRELANMGI